MTEIEGRKMPGPLKGLLKIAALLLILYLAVQYSTLLGFLLFVLLLLLAAISIIRPMPSLGLPSRAFGVAVGAAVFMGGTAFIVTAEESRLADLKASDPNAYLAELAQSSNQTRYLKELQALAPERYAAEKERIELAAAAKEQQKKSDTERKAQQEKAAAELKQRAAQNKANEDRRYGFHCLSEWDGSHRAFKEAVKSALRAPDSFEYVETATLPVKDGWNKIIMTYRAQNGFGGVNVAQAVGSFNNVTCDVRVEAIE